jgi:hypothetical protein
LVVLSRSVFNYRPNLGIHLLLPEMPLDAKMDCQCHDDERRGAQNQNCKK